MTNKELLGYYAKHYTLSDEELDQLVDIIFPMNDTERLQFFLEHNCI